MGDMTGSKKAYHAFPYPHAPLRGVVVGGVVVVVVVVVVGRSKIN